jgi:hypothetical protein
MGMIGNTPGIPETTETDHCTTTSPHCDRNRYVHNMALTLAARIWSTYTRDHTDQMHMATATRELEAEVDMLEPDEGIEI